MIEKGKMEIIRWIREMRGIAQALMIPATLATFLHHGETIKHLQTSQASYMMVKQIDKQKGRKEKERRKGK